MILSALVDERAADGQIRRDARKDVEDWLAKPEDEAELAEHLLETWGMEDSFGEIEGAVVYGEAT